MLGSEHPELMRGGDAAETSPQDQYPSQSYSSYESGLAMYFLKLSTNPLMP